ncbi:unnamed protein product, partial [Ixodes pacificus]
RLPFVLRILLENLLRHEDGKHVKIEDVKRFAECVHSGKSCEINFMPARVMMQDFTGVPALVDLAAMRDCLHREGKDPSKISPKIPVDLVVDHSVQVDFYGTQDALAKNVDMEMSRNQERYEFLKWGQSALKNFRVVPPGMGICHQVNLEYLSKVVWNDGTFLCPDTLIGTDSHTTMVNGMSVFGWGVGGIEAEATMLGQPIVMVVPEVVGLRLYGKLSEGVTATDLVLTITHILREKGVVGKFVEFFGEGLEHLSVFDRATVANMAPEYGATCGFFPFDQMTLDYLNVTGRPKEFLGLVESYMRLQSLWRSDGVQYSDKVEIDLGEIQPVVAGPKRPQDKVLLSQIAKTMPAFENAQQSSDAPVRNGDVVIAAITSCTNTSNPYAMMAAGIVARKARRLGLKSKSWVKTSLTPGSRVVGVYLKMSGLQEDLDSLGFNVAGYGCATCIGNSGPLSPLIEDCIRSQGLTVASVLSGNRNFEGRIHPCVQANFLASPALVVIYALAGTVLVDIMHHPVCKDASGRDIYLRDLWPSNSAVNEVVSACVGREIFVEKYANIFNGDENWQRIRSVGDVTYQWNPESTYVQSPSYFQNFKSGKRLGCGEDFTINNARILLMLGDSVTTDHISPAGNIAPDSPAGRFLVHCGVAREGFNSYGARRGNHDVMVRGTFANIRIRNEMLPGIEGGVTRYIPTQEVLPVFDAAARYQQDGVPTVIVAGKEYGVGSSRDWAAKGTMLLGVKAVIAESFERIHKSNLIGMGVVPLILKSKASLSLVGDEFISISGKIGVGTKMCCKIRYGSGAEKEVDLVCAVDTAIEVEYLAAGGVLHYVLEK